MTRRQIAALASLSAAVFLVAVDGNVLAIAVPQISEQLDPTYTEILWIGDIYSFVVAGLLVTMGNVGDRVGRKRMLMVATLGFGVMSVAAAMSTSPSALIVARALQGAAGAGAMPATLALIRSTFTGQKSRRRAIGVWSAAGSAGAAAGPTIAGFLLENFYWGSVFLINVPVVVFILGVGTWSLRESRGDASQPLDPVSIIMSTAGILVGVYGITELAHSGLAYWPGWLGLALSIPLLWGFLRRQRLLPVPLLDLGLFRQRPFSAAILAQTSVVFAATGALFFLPIFFQEVLGYSPAVSALAFLPASLSALVAAPLTASLVSRFGGRWTLLSGMVACAAGISAIGVLNQSPYVLLVVPLMLLGYGFSVVVTVAADLVIMAAPAERVGAASAVSETAYELGTAMGIAILGSAVTVVYQWRLDVPSQVPPQVRDIVAESLGHMGAATAGLPDQVRDQLQASALNAFTWGVAVAAISAGAMLALAAVATARMTTDYARGATSNRH